MSETNADIIKELKEKAVPIKGNTSDFLKKFSKDKPIPASPAERMWVTPISV